jgi:adenine-specific DNA-methyltransferase
METFLNIDINIKCGNSLISRYPLNADLRKALKGKRWNIDDYRLAVMTYRNAPDKEIKRNTEKLISDIKNDFETEISNSDSRVIRLNWLKGELFSLTATQGLNLYEKALLRQ